MYVHVSPKVHIGNYPRLYFHLSHGDGVSQLNQDLVDMANFTSQLALRSASISHHRLELQVGQSALSTEASAAWVLMFSCN